MLSRSLAMMLVNLANQHQIGTKIWWKLMDSEASFNWPDGVNVWPMYLGLHLIWLHAEECECMALVDNRIFFVFIMFKASLLCGVSLCSRAAASSCRKEPV